MLTISVLALLVFLLLTGMPLVFAMGLASTAYLFFADISFSMLTQRMTTAVDSFLILAIPFFYLAGELMNESGITGRIIAFANVLVGRLRAGLALVNICETKAGAPFQRRNAGKPAAISEKGGPPSSPR